MNYKKYEILKSILNYGLYLFESIVYYDKNDKSNCERCSDTGYCCNYCKIYFCEDYFDHIIHYDFNYCKYSLLYR